MAYGLVVHGGAGLLRSDDHEAVMLGCKAAVEAGRAFLATGGSAVDAVEAAVRTLEANPIFNAGYGSVLTSEGKAEMDALIMDGSTFKIGAVAAVTRVQHPVTLARAVMERTPHHLLVGAGAEQFAAAESFPLVEPAAMITPERQREFESRLGLGGHDTVGAVALDLSGHVAVAVSTGGLRGKMPGRVGDSPIVGAGAYADDMLGAACATGVGEGIMRALLTFRAVDALSGGGSAQVAAEYALDIFGQRFGGDGGLILIDRDGGIGIAHNSPYMSAAWLDGDQVRAAVVHGQRRV